MPVADTSPHTAPDSAPVAGRSVDFGSFATCSSEADAPFSNAEKALTPSAPASSYMLGINAEPRPVGYGENSWLSSIIVAMLVLLALNFSHCRQLFKNFRQNLIGIRHRSNAFDNRTANETHTLLLIILLLCLSEGILMFSAAETGGLIEDSSGVFSMTMIFAGIAAAFYGWQLVTYAIIGNVFADREAASQWRKGFNASQVLLSFLLLVPALVALFYPDSSKIMLSIAAISYIFVRILFICKGFRIFFTNFQSLLYFILYLCALEISPLLILRRLSLSILHFFEFTA